MAKRRRIQGKDPALCQETAECPHPALPGRRVCKACWTELHRAAKAKYERSPLGKATRSIYQMSPLCQATRAVWALSPAGRASIEATQRRATEKRKARRRARGSQ